MTHGVDAAYSFNSTVSMILSQLEIPPLPLVVCTDSFSLYECIVKLGTTNEKRLMIDVMALRQMYERRELAEVRWIDGNSNPADSMTKAAPNQALETFITTGGMTVNVNGWVDRRSKEI
ncbi:hypothetical protein K3495_g15165 [Podosphaera aphanis]|nr:hypothetical protein K3495_g15165 [Podosphaera aphanis]